MSIQADRRRLSGQTFKDQTFEGMDLRGGLAASSVWLNCEFIRVKFGQADFGNATFDGCSFIGCDFGQATLVSRIYHCSFAQVGFDQGNFSGSHIVKTSFSGCRFQYANFFRATLQEVRLSRCNLHGANLDFAQTFGVDFRGSNLWAAVIPLNCAFFAGNRFDSDQIHRFMALLDHGTNDPVWQEYRQHIPPKQWALIHRLVESEKADAGREDAGRGDGGNLDSQGVPIGADGRDPERAAPERVDGGIA